MDGALLALVGFDFGILILIGVWAGHGGNTRLMVGLIASAVFGVLIGWIVYIPAALVTRAYLRGRVEDLAG